MKIINNKHYQSCKWVMLPTNKPTGIFTIKNSKLYYSLVKRSRDYAEGKYLYILSDEEIKESDRVLDTRSDIVEKSLFNQKELQDGFKKIITTTNPELNKDGVAKISDEFLQEFVKRYNDYTLGEKVLVEVKELYSGEVLAESGGFKLETEPIYNIKTSVYNTISIMFEEEDDWNNFEAQYDEWLSNTKVETSYESSMWMLRFLKENFKPPTRK